MTFNYLNKHSMNRITKLEFDAIIDNLLVDRFFPENVHIPAFGVRFSIKTYPEFKEDLYKAYYENGEQGLILMLEKVKNNPAINIGYKTTKKIIHDHFAAIGITDEKEKIKYVDDIVKNIESGQKPKIEGMSDES